MLLVCIDQPLMIWRAPLFILFYSSCGFSVCSSSTNVFTKYVTLDHFSYLSTFLMDHIGRSYTYHSIYYGPDNPTRICTKILNAKWKRWRNQEGMRAPYLYYSIAHVVFPMSIFYNLLYQISNSRTFLIYFLDISTL